MPIYGYQRAVVDPAYGLLEMREVSFALSPADLRRVAAFLQYCADGIEAGHWRSSHEHLDVYDRAWRREHPDLDVIVLRDHDADS